MEWTVIERNDSLPMPSTVYYVQSVFERRQLKLEFDPFVDLPFSQNVGRIS